MRYAVVIPARDEQKIIQYTINSIQSQTILPQRIIVVNDNSTDDTEKIALNSGCEVVRFSKIHVNWVARKELANIINLGLEQLDECDLDYIMILGADHILSTDYVNQLSKKMDEDRVVIGSGSIDGEYAVTPRGSGRLIDYKWFKKLGLRYPIKYGYESYLIMKSLSQGYQKGYYSEITSRTQRKTSSGYKPIMFFRYGQAYNALGYPFHYAIFRCAILLKKRKILSAIYFQVGFLFTRPEKYDDSLRKFIRDKQSINMSSLANKKKIKECIERFMKS